MHARGVGAYCIIGRKHYRENLRIRQQHVMWQVSGPLFRYHRSMYLLQYMVSKTYLHCQQIRTRNGQGWPTSAGAVSYASRIQFVEPTPLRASNFCPRPRTWCWGLPGFPLLTTPSYQHVCGLQHGTQQKLRPSCF